MLSLINNSASSQTSQNELENLLIEKRNLVNIFKLVVKDLIDSSSIKLNKNKSIESSTSFELFFDVFENVLNHGFRGKRGYFRSKDFNSLLDIVEAKFDSVNKNLKSIKDISEIKTSLGRVRAWLRILLMQKQLAETFSLLIQEKQLLGEMYDQEAIMLSDEASMIVGLLIGLNGLDFSIDLKSILDIIDLPLHLINYSNYLRERIPSEFDDTTSQQESENKICEIYNQKSFVEELNKKQEVQLDYLNKKLADLEQLCSDLRDELVVYKSDNTDLKARLDKTETEKQEIENEYKQKYETLVNDHNLERETYLNSKAGLDSMYIELQKKILDEQKQRTSLENELTVQQAMKNELETALKLMDHSLTDKQDVINRLRDQLEQVKSINLELNEKSANLEQESNKTKLKLNELNSENETLKQDLNRIKTQFSEITSVLNSQSEDSVIYKQKCERLEADMAIEKNWRVELQAEVNTKNDLIKILNAKLNRSDEVLREVEHLRIENLGLKEVNSDLEKTLEEMGSKLGTSHLKIEDFKEVSKQVNEFQWEQDEKVTNCKLCVKEFSVSRRKHHCRRCGGIFCNECSVSCFFKL